MKTLYFNAFSGISGDMTLGALVDLGVPAEYLKDQLAKLHIDDEFSLDFQVTQKMGITGTRAHVHVHEGEHHHHDDDEHHHHHHHEHRNLHSISHIIEGSKISERAKEWAMKIFQEVAVAEAKVHGTTVDEVHFHEVGATDSIVDIVGAAICLDYLNPDRIIASPVEVGGGFVKCAHGVFPVPAPATTEILKGIPCTYGKVNSETTTPTGAAILKAMVHDFQQSPQLNIEKIAYGLGYKDFEIPNVLRVMWAEEISSASGDYDREENVLIECNLDDMNNEDFLPLMDLLFDAGALDVYLTPITMKKNRPAVKLSVLSASDKKDQLIPVIFQHSTSFGVRITAVDKVMLKREMKTVKTSLGDITVKIEMTSEDRKGKWKPEFEDLKKIALNNEISLPHVRSIVMKEIGDLL